MKTRIIIYISVLFFGISIFLYIMPEKPSWSPWYCSQYSGFHSYAWGGGSEKCLEAGCKIEKIKEMDDPLIFDDDGFLYKCISKSH